MARKLARLTPLLGGLVVLGAALVMLTLTGSDRPREAAPRPAAAAAARPAAFDVAPSVKPRQRKALRARVRAASRPVRRPALKAYAPPAWAKARPAERRREQRARRINPIAEPGLRSLGVAANADRIVSDEFNAPALDTSVWTFVNPVGDATLNMTGTHARISVPAGVRHDLWNTTDEVPRLMQAAPNTDFEVEAKFDTAVGAAYQLQGILVQQDADDLLRIETLHDGGGARLFIARIASGSASVLHYGAVAGGPPLHLRVKREGSSWTVSTSTDGTNWTTGATFSQSLNVSAIGPYAGNSGEFPPAFTTSVDYFRAIAAEPLDTTPPVVSGITHSPSGVGAVVRWQTDEPASSAVAYGPDTSYSSGVVGRSARVTSHEIVLTGLACGTVYHYQVRSRDKAANEAASTDRTFTTAACPAAITSDDFDGPQLDSSLWTFVDRVGDTSAALSGGHAEIAVPAGSRHDLWTGADEVSRLVQAAPNSNFEVEAKWSSAPVAGFQLQGILVVQDADDMLRIETHHDGGGSSLFVARIAGGVATTLHYAPIAGGAPVYFRLKRTGNTFTLRTSADGASWTTGATFGSAMNVTAIGPFAGNSGSNPPAFSSRVDYFRDIPPDLTPPTIGNVASEQNGVAATVTWNTNEPGTSEIRYGQTTAYEAGSVTRDGFVQQHSVVLHGLACGTTYHLQVRSRDAAGNLASAPDRTLTTAACPDHIVSDEFDGTALDTSKWTLIDPVGDAALTIGGGHARIAVPAGVRHDLWTGVDEMPRLLQAAPDDDFEVEVKYDSAVATGYQMQGIIVEQDADDLLRIETHHDGGGAQLFVAGVSGGVASGIASRPIPESASFWLRVSRVGDTWTVRYSRDGQGWAVGATFTRALTVTAVGPFAGNSGMSPPAFAGNFDYFREITDRTPPVVTRVEVSPRANSAIVTWTTDEPATSVAEHGATVSYGQTTTDPKLQTRHWMRVTGLTCATSYHLRVRSADQLGNSAVSGDQPFTTAGCTGAAAPQIDVWGGATQRFGTVGIPQRWVNVRGNVYDPQGVATLRATLNGEHTQNLTIGPDELRLERAGDFNLELNRDVLLPGDNEVVLTATDAAGNTATKTITVDWRGFSAGAPPSGNGPVLVVVAHGDDALLGAAGIIRRHKLAGRRVYVAAATNGDEPLSGDESGYCGAADGDPATTAQRGLTLSQETITAVGLLGLQHSTNLSQTELIFLGYPNYSLIRIAELAGAPWPGGGTQLHRTYGEDADGSTLTCNGELRYLLDGRHSQLTATDLAADFDALMQVTQPTDIYTLVDFDGHIDHAEVARQTVASVRRLNLSARIHGTVVHPHESGSCMGFSAANWPNPARVDDDPLSRFTPTIEFTAPPTPTCGAPAGEGWGPLGPPNESVEVPAEMQLTNPVQNLKWRALNVWDSQCPPDQPEHVTCGYFNAFAKRNEFFWTRTYSGQTAWPTTYTTDWTSTASIPDKAQIVEGDWAYELADDGIRPVATGFDRLLTLGQFDWRSYEVSVPVTVHWTDATKGSAGIGLGLGWQGHTNYANLQPRLGHPYGGLCGFGRSFAEPAQPRLEIVRNPGANEDTIMAAENPPRPFKLGAEYTMRFRRVDLGNGSSRYSCKFWESSGAEPSGWDLAVDLPDQLDTSSAWRGSAYLLAHNADATFGDVQIVPLGN